MKPQSSLENSPGKASAEGVLMDIRRLTRCHPSALAVWNGAICHGYPSSGRPAEVTTLSCSHRIDG